MYNEIQKLKSMGCSKSHTAGQIQINFRTVRRYWDMAPADYATAFKVLHRNMKNSTASRYEQESGAGCAPRPPAELGTFHIALYPEWDSTIAKQNTFILSVQQPVLRLVGPYRKQKGASDNAKGTNSDVFPRKTTSDPDTHI